jgi:Subtilisin inhibitor-like
MTSHVLRPRPRARYLLIAAVCAAAATACGAAPAPASSPGTPAAAKVSLHIRVTGGSGGAANWTLQCDPTGGSHPSPAAACKVLLRAKDPFAPVPRGIMCPMIVAGTREAKVTGTYFGRHIDTTFSQGGCQEARWTKIGQIFY